MRKSFEGNYHPLSNAQVYATGLCTCNALANEVCILVSGLKSNLNRKMPSQTDLCVFTFTKDFCVNVCLYVVDMLCKQPLTFGLCTSTVCSNLLQPKQIHLNLLCNLLYISLFNPVEPQVSVLYVC